ncbi:response regulator [candidate division KSB1 bacterium]|nr:response regulator [candidate division KSB1 bacterium]
MVWSLLPITLYKNLRKNFIFEFHPYLCVLNVDLVSVQRIGAMTKREQSILIINDEKNSNNELFKTLRERNYQVEFSNGEQWHQLLITRTYDLVIADIQLCGVDGMKIVAEARKIKTSPAVIVIASDATIKAAVAAMKAGAYNYMTKPIKKEELLTTVDQYFMQRKPKSSNFKNIIGKSTKMKHVFEMVETVANSKATVLIYGESGTGKELIASAIHYGSPRKDGPFVKTNCAAVPETLAESELFGHEKGAFTGAIKDAKGRFELADNGTLLLDEVSEMSLSMQAKLLRVLQEKEYEKVGNPKSVPVNVRIIATTNKDLKTEVKENRFREDLYYRLNVVPIHLPPLRERKQDIPLLIDYFLKKYSCENNRNNISCSDDVIDALMEYHYPGNVRELEHLIERSVVICREKVIRPKHLDVLFTEKPYTKANIKVVNIPAETLEEVEKKQIYKILKQCNGNKTLAARRLGITARTLRNKLTRYNGEDSKKNNDPE